MDSQHSHRTPHHLQVSYYRFMFHVDERNGNTSYHHINLYSRERRENGDELTHLPSQSDQRVVLNEHQWDSVNRNSSNGMSQFAFIESGL